MRHLVPLLFGLLLVGCTSPTPTPSPSPATSTGAATSAAPTPSGAEPLAVGDCTGKLELSGASLEPVAKLGCKQTHYWEVSAQSPVDQGTYPGADALAELAADSCAASFTDYVGVAAAYSRYVPAYLAPQEASWADPANRTITCLVGSASGGLVGSAKGDTSLFPQVGECTGPQDVTAAELELIDCSKAHYYEVFAQQKISGKSAPTKKQVQQLFTKVCLAGFKKFVGVAADKSKFEATYFVASSELWKKVDDHRIVCSAGSPDGKIKQTLKGRNK